MNICHEFLTWQQHSAATELKKCMQYIIFGRIKRLFSRNDLLLFWFTLNFVFLTLGSLQIHSVGAIPIKILCSKNALKIKIRRIPFLLFLPSSSVQKAMKKGDNCFWECQNGFKGGVYQQKKLIRLKLLFFYSNKNCHNLNSLHMVASHIFAAIQNKKKNPISFL